MIDSNEPRDGDFVRYVDELMRRPHGAALPQTRSPGEVGKPARGERESLLQTLRDVLANRPGTPPPARSGPASAGLPAPAHTPTQPPASARQPAPLQPRTVPSSARTRAGDAGPDAAMVARVLTRLASIAIFAGVVLLAMSFAEDPPVPIDPIVGVAVLAGAAIVKRIAKGLA